MLREQPAQVYGLTLACTGAFYFNLTQSSASPRESYMKTNCKKERDGKKQSLIRAFESNVNSNRNRLWK